MKARKKMRGLLLAILLASLALVYFPADGQPGALVGHVLASSSAVQPSTGGCSEPPILSAEAIPSDIAAGNSQANVNCLAWQDFIAMNWLASPATCTADAEVPASSFGQPNNSAPVVWETYKKASEVFQAGAAPPSPWCSQEPAPEHARYPVARGYKILGLVGPGGRISEFAQANAGGAWLTGQNKNLTLYEVRLNRDEFNYIDANRLYNARVQRAFAEGPGIGLPDGTEQYRQYGKTGSMEFKASWIELPDPSQWPYFKTSRAYVFSPDGKAPPRLVTVGLTGLHIIHKTAKAPQFVWATFEHVNNAPSAADIQSGALLPWYTYYNRNCDPQTDHYRCAPNAQPVSASPEHPYFPNRPSDPYDAPMQVVRENPVSDTTFNNTAGLNQWVWNLIRGQNPESVFLNYQLVNVLWANSPAAVPPGAEVPLTAGNPLPNPNAQKVANTAMETYFQNTSTCLDCHTRAAIAAHGPKEFASDYSFLFSMADAP